MKHRGTPYTGGTKTRCTRRTFSRRLRETLRLRPRVDITFIPLFDHLIRLALSSLKHNRCQRAGRELAQARKLAGRSSAYPDPAQRMEWMRRSYENPSALQTARQRRDLERAMVAADAEQERP